MTTNSPNPVDGDVQAHQMPELTQEQRELLLCFINDAFKSLSGVEPESTKKYDENLGELTKQVFQVSLAALTTPPAQLLRPVELPDIKTARSDWSAWNWIEHLGGRFQNGKPGNYIEFGSVYAVAQMLKQYRRTVTAEVIAEIADSLRQQGYEVKE